MHAADLAGIAGSGAAGRVTIQDFEKFIANLEKHKLSQASTHARGRGRRHAPQLDAPARHCRVCPSVSTPCSPIAKPAIPNPGPRFMPCARWRVALAENSAPAGRLVGNKIVHPHAIDVGFAVEAEDGVLVPVLRNADKKPLNELVARYNELVELARQRKLPADATGGSIATVTNFGTFGLTWATPIPLPEQTLVLGMGADGSCRVGTQQRPICAGHGSQSDAELRSSRARWRRRGTIALTHRDTYADARTPLSIKGRRARSEHSPLRGQTQSRIGSRFGTIGWVQATSTSSAA